jgi:hypothetical protein
VFFVAVLEDPLAHAPSITTTKSLSKTNCEPARLQQKMKPTINLGCGRDPWGDVRVDVDSRGTANLILDFDQNDLPFSDKHFSQCRLWHVLEHSRAPQKLLSEAIRVSESVHAKYPYRYDRVTYLIRGFSMLDFFESWRQASAQFRDRLGRAGLSNNPQVHRWTVRPFGRYRLNTAEMFPFLRFGRKARLFKQVPLPRIPLEWECWYP